jgi:23S rRNA maturation mini-RNase III
VAVVIAWSADAVFNAVLRCCVIAQETRMHAAVNVLHYAVL